MHHHEQRPPDASTASDSPRASQRRDGEPGRPAASEHLQRSAGDSLPLDRVLARAVLERAGERVPAEPDVATPVAVPAEMPARQSILDLRSALDSPPVDESLAAPRDGRRLARKLLGEAAWARRTRKFDRADPGLGVLGELDKAIREYAHADTPYARATALLRLDRRASGWLSEQPRQGRLKRWFGGGLTPILNKLRSEIATELAVETATSGFAREKRLDEGNFPVVGRWVHKILDAVEELGLTNDAERIDALFDAFLAGLPEGFTYFSTGASDFLLTGRRANCQNLATALQALAAALGLEMGTEVISDGDFASGAGTDLVSEHEGNVRFSGEDDYTARRFVFSMHVVATFDGMYYDPTTRSKYAREEDAIAWKLREDGPDRRLVESVNDGATFPDGTRVSAQTAVLERDLDRDPDPDAEFGYYWVVKRKPPSRPPRPRAVPQTTTNAV